MPEWVFDRGRERHHDGTKFPYRPPIFKTKWPAMILEPIMDAADRKTLAENPGIEPEANKPRNGACALRVQAAELPQLIATNMRPFRRTIRRTELRQIVPLADTTIYDMERRGEFPRRFNLTARCVVWDLAEVEAWIAARRQASDLDQLKRAPSPDVRQRKRRPVKEMPAS